MPCFVPRASTRWAFFRNRFFSLDDVLDFALECVSRNLECVVYTLKHILNNSEYVVRCVVTLVGHRTLQFSITVITTFDRYYNSHLGASFDPKGGDTRYDGIANFTFIFFSVQNPKWYLYAKTIAEILP